MRAARLGVIEASEHTRELLNALLGGQIRNTRREFLLRHVQV